MLDFVGPLTGILTRKGKGGYVDRYREHGHVKTEAEFRELCCHKPKNKKNFQEPPEA